MNKITDLISRKRIKQVLLSSVSLALIFSMLILSGFSVRAETRNTKTTYSGEEIFRGIMLGEGEVANLFPEVWESKRDLMVSEEMTTFRNAVVSEIKSANPDFFDKFGEEMQSGDHLRIQAAMKDGAQKVKDVVQGSSFAKNMKSELSEDYEADRASSNVKVATHVLIAHQVVAVTDVVAIVAQIFWYTEPEVSGALYQERLVDAVVAKLSHNS